jgi:hypothetical protein
MKTIKSILVILACSLGTALHAQSNSTYGEMQTRFEKKKLNAKDSAAFVQSGIQKAQTLFEYGNVYKVNADNYSNQAYVQDRVPDLFYVHPTDTVVSLDNVMQQVQTIVNNQNGKPVEIAYEEKFGTLGQVFTVNTDPVFSADLILIKGIKQFGKRSKEVWQVYLTNPTFQD